MPALKVEYAKSGRSKCSNCKNFILNGELRIGTGTMMPGVDELTYKWRHICCFTSRQIKNAGSVDTIDGFDDLLDDHQPIMNKMLKGEYAGNLSWQGKFIHPDIKASEEAKAQKKEVKKESGKRRQRNSKKNDDDSSDTEDYDEDGHKVDGNNNNNNMMMMGTSSTANNNTSKAVAANNITGNNKKPMCPFGANCFKVAKEHFDQYAHPGDPDLDPEVAAAMNATSSTAPLAASAGKKIPAGKIIMKQAPLPGSVAGGPLAPPAPPPPAAKPTTATSNNAVVEQSGQGRKPCAYAEKCFRKNPDHFKEFSHPGDKDFVAAGSEDQKPKQTTTTATTTLNAAAAAPAPTPTPATTTTAASNDDDCADPNDPSRCKFGQMCFRADPAHFKKFKH